LYHPYQINRTFAEIQRPYSPSSIVQHVGKKRQWVRAIFQVRNVQNNHRYKRQDSANTWEECETTHKFSKKLHKFSNSERNVCQGFCS